MSGAPIRASWSVFFLLLAACGGPSGPEPDAGMDGGGDRPDTGTATPDAGRDGGRDAGMDGGPVGQCEGTPPSCELLDDTRCETVEGCSLESCTGTATPCPELGEEQCWGTRGCGWSGVQCSGTVADCDTVRTAAACGRQTGCAWGASTSCNGTPVPCEGRPAAACEMQVGCHPPRDGGVPDGSILMCDDMGMRPPGCILPEGPPPFAGCNPTDGIECDGDWTGTNPRTGADYCSPACTAGECCAPHDGRFHCIPRNTDGSCPGADIFVETDRIAGRYVIDQQFFGADDCAIAEGCVDDRGMRRLLRFDTYTPNIGGADLYLGPVPPSGTSTDVYTWSGCHGHHHFRSYAEYELLSADGCCVARTGRKQAFCLIDLGRYDTSMGGPNAVYNCGFQGIQRGYRDVYSSGLTCQWIDITDVPPGDYVLRIRLNAEHVLLEQDYENNEALIPVTIPPL